jgi:hypothetical protein
MKIRPVEAELFHAGGQTDGLTEGQTVGQAGRQAGRQADSHNEANRHFVTSA